MLQVLVEPIKQEFDLSDTQIGLVGGLAFAVLNVVLSVWIARYAERAHRLSLVSIGTVLWSIATAVCGFANSFFTLALARIGVGVGEAVGLPSTISLVADYFPIRERGRAMSVLMLAAPIGAFVGPVAAAMIAEPYGWRAAFWLASAPGFLLAILLYLLCREPERGRHDKVEALGEKVPSMSAVVRRLLGRHSLRHFLIGSTVACIVGFGVNMFLAAYFQRQHGLGLAEAGILTGLVASVPATISVIGSGWLCDKLATRDARWFGYIPGAALLLAAPLYIAAVANPSTLMAVALFALAAIFQYTYMVPGPTATQNMMHPQMRATASSLIGVAYGLGSGVGPLLVGWLSDCFGRTDAAAGLKWALSVTALGYLWAALHFFLGARRVREEMALPIDDV